MNNTLEGFNSRITDAEEQISDVEDRMVEILLQKEYRKNNKKKWWQASLRDLWDNIKHTNIHIIGVPQGEEKDIGPEIISE